MDLLILGGVFPVGVQVVLDQWVVSLLSIDCTLLNQSVMVDTDRIFHY